MSPEKLLAKITAKGITITGEGFGGSVTISQTDVAGALSFANLDRMTYLYALFKFSGAVDIPLLQQLYNHAYIRFAAMPQDRGWKLSKGRETFRNLVVLAINEHIDHGFNTCNQCKGAGVTSSQMQCKSCEGSGHKKPSSKLMADAIRVDRSNWVRVWSGRYDVVHKAITDINMDGKILGSLVRQFKDEKEKYCA